MRLDPRRLLAVAIAAVLLLPMATAMAVVLHELEHHESAAAPRDAVEILEAAAHGHRHDSQTAEHAHPAIKSSPPLPPGMSSELSLGAPAASPVTAEGSRLVRLPVAEVSLPPPRGTRVLLL